MSGLFAAVSGTGPAIVLLHGQPGGHDDWAAVTEQLKADYQVVAPDRPGYGRTGGRARGFRGNAAAVISLLDRLGVERATMVGYSWAGGAALALAEAAPDRVAALVLVSSVCPGEPLGRLDRMLAVPAVGIAVTASGLFLATHALSLPPVRRAITRRREVTTAARGGPDPNAVVASWRQARVGQSFVTEQRCLIDELPHLEPGLARITVPTVVVQGDADRSVPPSAGHRLAAAIPGARLTTLTGIGHLVIHQRPDAVVAAIRQVAPPR